MTLQLAACHTHCVFLVHRPQVIFCTLLLFSQAANADVLQVSDIAVLCKCIGANNSIAVTAGEHSVTVVAHLLDSVIWETEYQFTLTQYAFVLCRFLH